MLDCLNIIIIAFLHLSQYFAKWSLCLEDQVSPYSLISSIVDQLLETVRID